MTERVLICASPGFNGRVEGLVGTIIMSGDLGPGHGPGVKVRFDEEVAHDVDGDGDSHEVFFTRDNEALPVVQAMDEVAARILGQLR